MCLIDVYKQKQRNQVTSFLKSLIFVTGFNLKVDLVGGYYDAGDNMKFGFPMAFTTTMLSWSLIEFGGLVKSELPNAKDAVRWATDFLLKATSHPDTIYVQVSLYILKKFKLWETEWFNVSVLIGW